MKIQLRPSLLKTRHTKVKYLIIHHTVCQYEIPESKIDNPKFQINYLLNKAIEKKESDLNYHFIVDKIRDDYQMIVCRPFSYICDYDDIDHDINKTALHVALMGSYDFKIPEHRAYEILAYRILAPLINHFSINPSRIYLHRDISNKKEESCPGSFINKEMIVSMVRRFIVK